MNVIITGAAKGIGRAAAEFFIKNSHTVHGIDILPSSIKDALYTHHIADISKKETLPDIKNAQILINNAGIQTADDNLFANDIETNLKGTINVTQKYAFQNKIKSVLFNASVSALTGNEFAGYVASKGGIISYMKHCAIKLANEYKATCNALCFGGVKTELNKNLMQNKELWDKIMNVTPLKRWATSEEAAQWIYFMTVTNTFCTGQAIDISGGERNCADLFVWE